MKKVLLLSFVFVFMFSSLAYAMTYEEFVEEYPNEFIYKICYPNGYVNYFSSPVEIEFSLDDYNLKRGKALVLGYPTGVTIIQMKSNGSVKSFSSGVLRVLADDVNRIGFEGDINIYRWNGNSFFLPTTSTFLKGLVGPIQTILPTGFGIVSVMLSVRLLTVYFRRYLPRSL